MTEQYTCPGCLRPAEVRNGTFTKHPGAEDFTIIETGSGTRVIGIGLTGRCSNVGRAVSRRVRRLIQNYRNSHGS